VVRRVRELVPAPAAWTAPSAAGAPPDVALRVERGTPCPGWFRVSRDGVAVFESDREGDLLPYLLWAIHTAALEALGRRFLLFHAGAVALDGCGVLLAAASGSGKSTLVAGLLGDGFQYLSDDIAPVDPATLHLVPFAKCVGLKRGARRPCRSVTSCSPGTWRAPLRRSRHSPAPRRWARCWSNRSISARAARPGSNGRCA
jgi:hypothetical protein